MTKQYTINQLLCVEKTLKSRLSQLKELSSESTKRTMWSEPNKVEEPTYDIKKVDAKLSKVTRALFDIDSAIKEANAKTKVAMPDDFDFDGLMSPIE